jgi:hypothetical protein
MLLTQLPPWRFALAAGSIAEVNLLAFEALWEFYPGNTNCQLRKLKFDGYLSHGSAAAFGK